MKWPVFLKLFFYSYDFAKLDLKLNNFWIYKIFIIVTKFDNNAWITLFLIYYC